MPDLEQKLVIKALSEGFDKIDKDIADVGKSISDSGSTAGKGAMRFTELASQLSIAKQAFQAVAGGAKVAYDAISEGAALNQAQSQFENLAGSIGTTAESIDTKLKAATSGMMSQAERMAGASQIISLGLAQNEEDVVRLAKATGTLGLDMQQVILTFANNSKARLDALGLSVQGVTMKAAELQAQGFTGDAFDEAVLIGLEEKMTLLGDASETTAGQLKRLESDWADLTNQAKQYAAETAGPVVSALTRNLDQFGLLNDALEKGIITQAEYNKARYVQDEKQRAAFIRETTRAVEDYDAALQSATRAEMGAWEARKAMVPVTEELIARTGEAIRGAGGIDAYRMAAEGSLSTEEARAVALANTVKATKAAEEALAAETKAMAESTARKEENARITQELASATGDYFTMAIEAGDNQEDLNSVLYEAADAAGADAEALASLMYATGDYTKAQINAALQTAAVTAEATRLGESIAAGTMTVHEATAALQEFATDWTASATINTDEDKFRNLLRSLIEFDGKTFRATAAVDTQGGVPSGSAPAPSGKGGAKVPEFAGGGTVPGPLGSPQLILAHGGETVAPPGQNSLTITQIFNGSSPNAMNQARDGVLDAARAIGLTGYA